MVADIGNTIDFLHRMRALKVRGANGYVGTSNIAWNTLDYSLHFCKGLLALWDLLLDGVQLVPISEMEQWQCLEDVDLSFNDLNELDETVRLLGKVERLNISHNNLLDIGWHLQHLTSLTELDLSKNGIVTVERWNEKLGNIKRLVLASNSIKDLTGLTKLYSLEYLDLKNNDIASTEVAHSLGNLPCLETLILRGNPIRKVVEYRTRVLEAFGDRSDEVKLDGKRADARELNTIRVRLALRKAKEEKEEKERKRKEKIDEKIQYIAGDVDSSIAKKT
uniref:LRRcap domain-containing protein n=1 Tax=Heterorhabditis bacteriophora TaxID=37862 RepID=A0A1I7WM44_HETBA